MHSGVLSAHLAGVLALVVLAGAAGGQVVINEFLPDPEGADAGAEFVELFNAGNQTLALAGMRLQFANGAEGPTWYTRWTGAVEDQLEPAQRFLIVDRNWLGGVPADAEVYLGLQNGPDAVRLEQDGVTLDLVGYGALTDESLFEGHPAAIAAGLALGRRPDGRDTDDNLADFVQTDPTPGAVNFEPYAFRVENLNLEPPSLPQAGLRVVISMELENNGIHFLPAGILSVGVGEDAVAVHWDELAPGQFCALQCIVRPTRQGRQPLWLGLPVAALAQDLRIEAGHLQVGPHDLVLSEVLGTPDRNQGEWVELLAAGSAALSTQGYSLRDEDGAWLTLPAVTLSPGERMVLAQDASALVQWCQDNLAHGAVSACGANQTPGQLIQFPGAWPTLNNTAPQSRDFPDRIWLASPDGTVVDHVFLTIAGLAAGVQLPAGKSLERLNVWPAGPGTTNWSVCTHPTGSTPGCPNSVSQPATDRLELHLVPELLNRESGDSSLHIRFTLEAPANGWAVRIFDLWGNLVRDLGGDGLGPGPRDLLWDGRDDRGQCLGSGGYVVYLQTADGSGNSLNSAKVLAAVRNGQSR